MQTKDIISQPLSTEWAIAHPHRYVKKAEVTNRTVQRGYTLKVTLVNFNTYCETSAQSQDVNDIRFRVTTGDRTKRFLVTDGNGNYIVAPATSFIAKYADMEKLWSESEAKQQAHEAKRLLRENVRQDAVAQASVNRDAIRESIADGLKALLGFQGALGTRIDVDIMGDFIETEGQPLRYETKLVGSVNIPYDQFMRLVEKFNQLQDA